MIKLLQQYRIIDTHTLGLVAQAILNLLHKRALIPYQRIDYLRGIAASDPEKALTEISKELTALKVNRNRKEI